MPSETENVQITIKKAFEAGYLNAASSLSVLVNKKFLFEGFYQTSYRIDSISLDTQYINSLGGLTLLTTEVFGDVHGKSYLFLSSHDCEVLTKNIPHSGNSKINFHREFLKEVDNILSAAVISKLSDGLNMKMYGDVPVWVGAVDEKIAQIINYDFQDRSSEVHVSNIHFICDGIPEVRPLFIWVMDAKLSAKAIEYDVV